jgi:hypothetical protein
MGRTPASAVAASVAAVAARNNDNFANNDLMKAPLLTEGPAPGRT